MMRFKRDFEILEQFLYLIRAKPSGSPKELAQQLGISVRSLYRLIHWLRERGIPLHYNRYLHCYECSQNIHIYLHLEVTANSQKEPKHIFLLDINI